jgi:hypothetical protein
MLILALVLRLPAVWEALPAAYNSTEFYLAKISLNMGARQSLDPLIYVYPTFYTYILLGLYGGYYTVGKLIGIFPDRTSFAVEFLIEPSNFFLLGRLMNLLVSLLTIWLLYRILEKYQSKFVAGVAAAMACLCQCYIEFSGYATTDVLLIFFSTLTVLYFVIIDHAPRLSSLFVQGLCCGLAIAGKYNAGFLAVGILIANYGLSRKYRLNYFKITLISLAGMGTSFLLTNPLWLVIPDKYYEGLSYRAAQMGVAVSIDQGINYIWEISQLLKKEWVIGLSFLAGTVFVFWKQSKYFLPQLVIVLLTFLYVGSWRKKGLDYLFALFPIWIIFATAWLDYLCLNILKKERYKIYVLGLILIPSLFLSLYSTILYLNRDTREQATAWLIDNHQPGLKYCYDNHHWDLAIFDIDRYVNYGAGSVYLPAEVKQAVEKYRNDKRNISMIPIMYESPDPVYSGSNPYEKDESFYKRKDLKMLLDEGTSFLISNGDFIKTYQRVPIEQYPPTLAARISEIRDFYTRVEKNFKPIRVFSPGLWRKGPEIKIYDLRDAVSSSMVD